MSVTAINADADLEQQIAEQREKAERVMRSAMRTRNRQQKKKLLDEARAHYQNMTLLISKRSDERVEQMERERNLR